MPGDAGTGARLRSDHAAAGVAPEVVCEFTAAGRRFEVTRSPAWERPKKRGTGTTLEQARVLVRELGGRRLAAGDRPDRRGRRPARRPCSASALDQFTKLVLLPQGEFAAFLRSGAEERRTLLERLFGTDRFTAVQQWMRETQVGYRQEVDAADSRCATLVARAEQAAGMAGVAPAAEEVAPPDEQVSRLRIAVEAALEAARQVRVAAQERAQHAAAEHRAAVELARLQARHTELRARAAALQCEAPDHAGRLSRLAAARRAGAIAAWTGPLREARSRSRRALAGVDEAMAALAAAGGEGPREGRAGRGRLEELDDEALQAHARQGRELLGATRRRRAGGH